MAVVTSSPNLGQACHCHAWHSRSPEISLFSAIHVVVDEQIPACSLLTFYYSNPQKEHERPKFTVSSLFVMFTASSHTAFHTYGLVLKQRDVTNPYSITACKFPKHREMSY